MDTASLGMSAPRPFDPDAADVRALGEAVAALVARHYAALPSLPVVPAVTPAQTFAAFREAVPEDPADWPSLLE